MNERRAVARDQAQAVPREKGGELLWSRKGVVPDVDTGGEYSPLVTPSRNIAVGGVSLTATIPGLAGDEVNVYIIKNRGRDDELTIASLRLSGTAAYAWKSLSPVVQLIGRKDTWSLMCYQFGTTAADLTGSIELVD